MKKTFYTAATFPYGNTIVKKLRTGIVVTFIFTASLMGAIPIENYEARQESNTTEIVTTISAKSTLTKDIIPVTILADNHSTLMYKTECAFNRMIELHPQAIELAPVMHFVTERVGTINAERVMMDCDMGNKVLNVAYRLPGDILFSINKPLDTMDDELVMFNVYHLRELLVSDMASIDMLGQYIHNVEKKIAEQA